MTRPFLSIGSLRTVPLYVYCCDAPLAPRNEYTTRYEQSRVVSQEVRRNVAFHASRSISALAAGRHVPSLSRICRVTGAAESLRGGNWAESFSVPRLSV